MWLESDSYKSERKYRRLHAPQTQLTKFTSTFNIHLDNFKYRLQKSFGGKSPNTNQLSVWQSCEDREPFTDIAKLAYKKENPIP